MTLISITPATGDTDSLKRVLDWYENLPVPDLGTCPDCGADYAELEFASRVPCGAKDGDLA